MDSAATHPASRADERSQLNRLAAQATTHCLIGCALGEVSSMAIATAHQNLPHLLSHAIRVSS